MLTLPRICACGAIIHPCYWIEGRCENCCAALWAKLKIKGNAITIRGHLNHRKGSSPKCDDDRAAEHFERDIEAVASPAPKQSRRDQLLMGGYGKVKRT